jgi:uncharacterized membrane protein
MKVAKIFFWFGVAFAVVGILAFPLFFVRSAGWLTALALAVVIVGLVFFIVSAWALVQADEAKTSGLLKDAKTPKAY